MSHWLHSSPPRIVRPGWPSAPINFLNPQFAGFGERGKKSSRIAVVREGHRFEAKVFNSLVESAEADGWYLFPEFCFSFSFPTGKKSKAFIDLLAINPVLGAIAVLEMKRSHTAESYKQLWKYMAMCRSYFHQSYAVMGYEICLYQGNSLEYPGPHRWLSPGKLMAEDWDGRGFPKVSVVPWYMGSFSL